MPIRRLLYYGVNENPLQMKCKDHNGKRIIEANADIRKVIKRKEEYFREDRVFPLGNDERDAFRMGWERAVLFEKQNGFFKGKELFNVSTKVKTEASFFEKKEFSQITTQAVDTCTVVCIETNTEYLLAHFLRREFDNFAEMYQKDLFPLTGPVLTAFFSGLSVEKRSEFDMLIQQMKPAQVIHFDRDYHIPDKKFSQEYYFSHIEFGIGWDNIGPAYFGDLIYRAAYDSPASVFQAEQSSYYTFEYNQLNNLSGLQKDAEPLAAEEIAGWCGTDEDSGSENVDDEGGGNESDGSDSGCCIIS